MKLLKRAFVVFIVLISIVLSILWVVTSLFEDKVGETVLKQINKKIVHPIEVQSYDLTIFKTFPSFSIVLNSVTVPDRKKKELLVADNIALQLKLFPLLKGAVSVDGFSINDGIVSIETYKGGRANYDIAIDSKKEEGGESSSSEFAISLEEATFSDIDIIYKDVEEKITWRGGVDKIVMSGDFSEKNIDVKVDGKLFSDYLKQPSGKSLIELPLKTSFDLDADFKEQIFDIEKGIFEVGENKLKVDGVIDENKYHTLYDLSIEAIDMDLSSVLGVLPASIVPAEIEGEGDFYFNAEISGKKSSTSDPHIVASMGLKDGEIEHDEIGDAIENLSFELDFDSEKGSSKKGELKINNIKGELDDQSFSGYFKMQNLDNPKIDGYLNGEFPMTAIASFMGDNIEEADGSIQIQGLSVSGYLQDMLKTYRIDRVKTAGYISFKEAMIRSNGHDIVFKKGDVSITTNKFSVKDIVIEGPDTEIEMDGYFENVLPVLLADSVNSNKANLEFEINLQAEEIDFDELIATFEVKGKEDIKEEASLDSINHEAIVHRERLTKLLNGNVTVEIDEYNWKSVEGKDFVGSLAFDGNKFRIKKIATEGIGGKYDIDGYVYFEKQPHLALNCRLDNINTSDFLKQFEDFDQDFFTHKNIEGDLFAKVKIDAFWDADGHFDEKKLAINADVEIKDGELIRFELLESSLKKIVKKKDLRHIKFSNLKNTFEIKNRSLYIPRMFIQSSALNLTLAGQHDFDNKFDYKMKVNTAQVLGNLLKLRDNNKKPIPAKEKGWLNTYTRIFGDPDNYEVKIGKKGVKEYLEGGRSILQNTIIVPVKKGKPATIGEPEEKVIVTEKGEKIIMSDEEIPESVDDVEDPETYINF